jgi:hypothetical protein
LKLLDRAAQALGAESGAMQEFYFDESSDLLVSRLVQDVEPFIERNKRLQNDGTDGYTPSREMRRVASIPNIVVHQWQQEGIDIFDRNDWPKVRARLNSREWSFLRTAPGRV